MSEGFGGADVVAEVVAVVGAVGEVEGLADDFQVHALPEAEVLGKAQIEFEERITAERVELGDGAGGRLSETVEAILGIGIATSVGEPVSGIARGYDNGIGCAATCVERVAGVGQRIGTGGAKLQDRCDLHSPGKVSNAAEGYVAALVIRIRSVFVAGKRVG